MRNQKTIKIDQEKHKTRVKNHNSEFPFAQIIVRIVFTSSSYFFCFIHAFDHQCKFLFNISLLKSKLFVFCLNYYKGNNNNENSKYQADHFYWWNTWLSFYIFFFILIMDNGQQSVFFIFTKSYTNMLFKTTHKVKVLEDWIEHWNFVLNNQRNGYSILNSGLI